MPRIMKKDAIFLIDGGVESYLLSLHGLSLPSSRVRRLPETRYAPVLGLLGATVELLTKACLVQARGVHVMYKNSDVTSGVYKFGTEVIEELRQGIRDNKPEFAFLWEYSDNVAKLQQEFLTFLAKFKLLQDIRAKGLHAGIGCSRDVTVATANDVYNFTKLLSSSKKIGAYLKNIPMPELPIRDREAILEDLSRRLAISKDINDKVDCLRGMYIVLPYIPEIQPEWLDAFDRIHIAPPSDEDVSYLVRSLTEAHSIYLLKNRGGKEGVPVRIEPANAAAIPIAVQNLKRELVTIPDQFNNDVLTANTRIGQKRLDLPIDDFIIDLYALGIENTGVLIAPINMLTAQQTWAYVAAAIQTQGAPRPYWFIIKYCNELERLKNYLQRAILIGNAFLKKRVNLVIQGIDALIDTREIQVDHGENILKDLMKYYLACVDRKDLTKSLMTPAYIKKNPMSEIVSLIISKYLEGAISAGPALESILAINELTDNDKKIARQLLYVCFKYNDRNGLIAVWRTNHLEGYKSEARKMMYYTDFIKNGPEIKDIDKEMF